MSGSAKNLVRVTLELTEQPDGVTSLLSYLDAEGDPESATGQSSWDRRRLRELTKRFQKRSNGPRLAINAEECRGFEEMLGGALLPGKVADAFIPLCDRVGDTPIEVRLLLGGQMVRVLPWELAALGGRPVFDGHVQVVREVATQREQVDVHGDGIFRVLGVTGRPDIPNAGKFEDPDLRSVFQDLGIADVAPVTVDMPASTGGIGEAIKLCEGYADVLVYWGHGEWSGLWLADNDDRPVGAKRILEVLTGPDGQPKVGVVVLVACWTGASGQWTKGLAESLAEAGIATIGVQAELHTKLAKVATECVVVALREADDVGSAVAKARAELRKRESVNIDEAWTVGAGGLLAVWAPRGSSLRLSKGAQGIPAAPRRRVKSGRLTLDRFVGRRAVIEKIVEFARGGSDDLVLVIEGRTGEGKSTFLRFLEQREVHGRPVLDVGVLRDPALVHDDRDAHGAEPVLHRISEGVWRRTGRTGLVDLQRKLQEVPLGSRWQKLVVDPLKEWFADNPDDRFVIGLDELDQITDDERDFLRDHVLRNFPSSVRFVCTSRRDAPLASLGLGHGRVDIRRTTLTSDDDSHGDDDVAELARRMLAELEIDDTIRERLISEIVRVADGVMLVARFVCQQVAARLDELGDGPKAMANLLMRLDSDDNPMWVLYAEALARVCNAPGGADRGRDTKTVLRTLSACRTGALSAQQIAWLLADRVDNLDESRVDELLQNPAIRPMWDGDYDGYFPDHLSLVDWLEADDRTTRTINRTIALRLLARPHLADGDKSLDRYGRAHAVDHAVRALTDLPEDLSPEDKRLIDLLRDWQHNSRGLEERIIELGSTRTANQYSSTELFVGERVPIGSLSPQHASNALRALAREGSLNNMRRDQLVSVVLNYLILHECSGFDAHLRQRLEYISSQTSMSLIHSALITQHYTDPTHYEPTSSLTICLDFDPASSVLARGGLDGELQLLMVERGEMYSMHPPPNFDDGNPITTIGLSKNARYIASGNSTGSIGITKLDHVSHDPVATRKVVVACSPIVHIEYSDDSSFAIFATEAGEIVFIDVRAFLIGGAYSILKLYIDGPVSDVSFIGPSEIAAMNDRGTLYKFFVLKDPHLIAIEGEIMDYMPTEYFRELKISRPPHLRLTRGYLRYGATGFSSSRLRDRSTGLEDFHSMGKVGKSTGYPCAAALIQRYG